MVKIIEAKTRREMMEFAKFPIRLYQDNPYYVPSFLADDYNVKNPKKNHAAIGCDCKCFLAIKDGKTVGRVCAIIVHASNQKFNEKNIRFNRFDFIEDREVFKKLLEAVEDYGREMGCTKMHGPWGFNDTDREGMMTEGYEGVSTYATAYSYPYYAQFMAELPEFQKESEWLEYRFYVDKFKEYMPRLEKFNNSMKARGYRDLTEELSVKQIIKKYGDKFFDVYNEAYRELDNYIPLNGKVKKDIINQFGLVINKDYFSCIVDQEDNVVAFGVATPDIGKSIKKHKGHAITALPGILKEIKKPTAIELTLIGVDPKLQRSALLGMVIYKFIKSCLKNGISVAPMDPVLTTNVKMHTAFKHYEPELYRKRQTYIKDIK